MKYFTISELTRSDTASIKKIDNTPNKEITEHLIELVEKLLDPLRSDWAKYCDDNQLGNAGIRISSGFRNKELNKAVGTDRGAISRVCSGLKQTSKGYI